jgi:hypothetical protein
VLALQAEALAAWKRQRARRSGRTTMRVMFLIASTSKKLTTRSGPAPDQLIEVTKFSNRLQRRPLLQEGEEGIGVAV